MEILNEVPVKYPIDSLLPDPTNPNVMSPEKMAGLRESIKRNGFLQYVVADQDMMIVDGHHRWEAAKGNGLTEIPVVRVRIDRPEERILVRQSMNKLHGTHDPVKDLADLKALRNWDSTALSTVLAISDEQFEKMQAVFGGDEQKREQDASKLGHHEDTFLHGNIKQIYLFFNNEEYSELIPRLQAIMKSFSVDDHTALFLRLVDYYENNTGGEAPQG